MKWEEVLRPLNRDFIQNEIAKSAYDHQRKVETKEKIIVGVNAFESKEKDQYKNFPDR